MYPEVKTTCLGDYEAIQMGNFANLDTTFSSSSSGPELRKVGTQEREAVNKMFADGSQIVDSVLNTPTSLTILQNTRLLLEVEIRDVEPVAGRDLTYRCLIKRRNGRTPSQSAKYDYFYNGDRLYHNLTSQQLLWEFDSVFVALRDGEERIKCIFIPADLTAEVFMTETR